VSRSGAPPPVLLPVSTRLPNGLAVAVAPLPHLHTVTIVAGVKVGSRHESPAQSGISHFLEHMLFRGTAEHPTAFEFNLAVEQLGGTLQAATHADFTTYELTLPPDALGEGVALVSEIFHAPALANLELERKIVLEEILDGVDEDGRDVDPDDVAHRALFGSHPLGHKVAGTDAAVRRLRREDLHAWHARHYVARNTSIALAGAVEPEAALALVERGFGRLAPGERATPAPVAALGRGPRTTSIEDTGSQADVRIVMPGVGHDDPLRTASEMLSRVLDDGMSARLFRTLIEDQGLAYDAFATYDPYEDVGLWLVGAAVEHGKAAALIRSALSLLAELRDRPIEARELEKAKTRALFELRALRDQAAAVADLVAVDRLFDREPSLEAEAARIEAVGLSELAAAARAIVPDHLQVIVVGALDEAVERETRKIVSAFR